MIKKRTSLRWLLMGILVLVASGFLAFQLSPWPSVLLIRRAFNKDAEKVNSALAKHVPPGVEEVLNISYDSHDSDALLDIYYPAWVLEKDSALTPVVWIHGGGFVSGHKGQVGNYCKILASKGYCVISVDYTIAPEAQYPTPVRQVNTALAFLQANAKNYHINPTGWILAGDSGGANIAAQLGNMSGDSAYAASLGIGPSLPRNLLKGLILFCGAYSVRPISGHGSHGKFMESVLWAYGGKKNIAANEKLSTLGVVEYVTSSFPASFISAGNGDPLLSHSRKLAEVLVSKGVSVDTLFYPAALEPPLPHEYQFNLDNDQGKLALDRMMGFLSRLR
jgi:acetyl esterase/lipase